MLEEEADEQYDEDEKESEEQKDDDEKESEEQDDEEQNDEEQNDDKAGKPAGKSQRTFTCELCEGDRTWTNRGAYYTHMHMRHRGFLSARRAEALAAGTWRPKRGERRGPATSAEKKASRSARSRVWTRPRASAQPESTGIVRPQRIKGVPDNPDGSSVHENHCDVCHLSWTRRGTYLMHMSTKHPKLPIQPRLRVDTPQSTGRRTSRGRNGGRARPAADSAPSSEAGGSENR